VPLLLQHLRGDDLALRDMALRTARDLPEPGITAALVAALDGLAPALQVLLLGVLVDRGGDAVVTAMEARANTGPEEVRVAALGALGRIGRASSGPILLAAARTPGGGAVADTAFASLARIPVPDTDAAVRAALASAEPALQVRLIGVLGERKAAGATGELLRLAASNDAAVSQAALRALGLITPPDRLPELIQLAVAMPDETRKTLADRAIVTTAMKVLEPERRADAVVGAFRNAKDPAGKAALLRPLGAIMRTMGGNHDVFFAVQAALKDPSPEVRAAAVRCLAEWPDAAPTTTLLALVKQKDLPSEQREVALRGAIRMATEVAAGRERSPLDARAALVEASAAVRTDEEKMMLVSALGNLLHPDALRLLQPYLEDAAVKSEAALAVVQVAPALLTAKDSSAIKAALARIAANEKDEDVRRRAARLARGETMPAAKKKAAAAPAGQALAPGQLFKGRDLTGWDGDPGVWRVRDGVIVGGSMAGNPRNEFLATKRSYRNFVLRLEYRLIGTEGFVNGGVQVRSVRIAQPPNEMSGYQADIGAGHSGCLYDESRRKKFLARGTDEQIKRLE
jgi:HEAT repeat protein